MDSKYPNQPPYSMTAMSYNQTPANVVVMPLELEKHSAATTCSNCHSQVNTNVEDKVSGGGWIWALLCCLCGSWLLSLLVKCMDCFREWNHYCPRCNTKLATYSPSASSGVIALLALATVGVIALEVVVVVFYVMPKIQCIQTGGANC